jgi:hypothetical protein
MPAQPLFVLKNRDESTQRHHILRRMKSNLSEGSFVVCGVCGRVSFMVSLLINGVIALSKLGRALQFCLVWQAENNDYSSILHLAFIPASYLREPALLACHICAADTLCNTSPVTGHHGTNSLTARTSATRPRAITVAIALTRDVVRIAKASTTNKPSAPNTLDSFPKTFPTAVVPAK